MKKSKFMKLVLRTKNGAGQFGSAIPYSGNDTGKYTYLFTAKHCILEKDADTYNGLTLEYNQEAIQEFIEIPFIDIIICKDSDFAIIVCAKEVFQEKVDISIGYRVLSDNREPKCGQELIFSGFPKALKFERKQIFRAKYNDSVGQEYFTIESETPLDTHEKSELDQIPGISGGGIFFEEKNGWFLLGIILSLTPGFRNLSCYRLGGNINSLLSEKGFPNIDLGGEKPILNDLFHFISQDSEFLFPETPSPEIPRHNIINTLEKKIKEYDLFFIEGETGIGKTNILSQFMRLHPNSCIAYFIDPTHPHSYDPDTILREIFRQFHYFIKQKDHHHHHHHDDDDDLFEYLDYSKPLKNLMHTVRKKIRKEKLFLIFDGLSELEESDLSLIRSRVIEVLPVGADNFKTLFSGSKESLLK